MIINIIAWIVVIGVVLGLIVCLLSPIFAIIAAVVEWKMNDPNWTGKIDAITGEKIMKH